LGTPLPAEEAEEIGLIHHAVEEEDFDEAVRTLASKLAHMPTRGLGLTKKALHAAMTHDLHSQLKLELDLQFEAAETDDYAEGVQAFLEKRNPQFKGT
ncbi:MAG TPA: 2-(1,2-epoxy-1,2-dihydrophenyl)acetyl-CoA isomerase, partial [Flavobacteriales bacterium]|nr:2-(1,2-epoxy-1,2-dihydrophenyl)acetyl-CoA isomerase [Flavobacteriales bacterium]